jgi:hypothetical protein
MNVDEIVAALGEATDVQLSEALTAINAEGRAVPAENTPENVDKLEKLAAARKAVLGEQTRRAELASKGDAARSAFADADKDKGADKDATDKGTEGTEGESKNKDAAPAKEVPMNEPGAEPQEGTTGTADAPPAGTEGGDAVTASAKLGDIGKQRKDKAPASAALTVTGRTTALGNSPNFSAGQELTRKSLAESLSERWSSLRGTRSSGKHYVARVVTEFPEERTLRQDASFNENASKLEKVAELATKPEALTAAGGFCAPLENLYDIDVLGITARPIRDALSRFQVARGGIQYRPPMDALAMTAGLGIWTAEMDAAVGVVEGGTDIPDPVKTCAIVECPDLDTAVVEAIYLCLQFPNFTSRFDPEYVDANTRAALIAHARFAENNLLGKLLTGSKRLTAAKQVSAVRDVLVTIDKTVAYYRNRHRLDTMVPLRMILPRWVLDLFRADLCRGMGSAYDAQQLGIADATIVTWFRNRGVNVTFHLDGLDAQDLGAGGTSPEDIPAQNYANAAAGATVPGFIDKIDSVLFAEGDWLHLDGGTLDLGLVRDSSLNAINRYQTFVEDWEGVAFRGIESLRLVMEVQPTGMVAGTKDTSALVD